MKAYPHVYRAGAQGSAAGAVPVTSADLPELQTAPPPEFDGPPGVWSPGEFASGKAAGSRNIPVSDLERGAKDLDPHGWIIVCCASGTRSGMARRWLLRHGFQHVWNAGSWRNLR